MKDMNQPKFRAGQIFAWLCRGADDFDKMTDVPASLKEELAARKFRIGLLMPEKVQISALDGTRKYLFVLSDGNAI